MGGGLLDEEKRVLLVMLSRAKHGLVVTSARTHYGMYGAYQPRRCRWFGQIQGAGPCTWDSLEGHVDITLPTDGGDGPA